MLEEWRLEAGRPVRPCGSQEPGMRSQGSSSDHLPWDLLEAMDLNHPWTLARCQENALSFASSVPEVPPRILSQKNWFL